MNHSNIQYTFSDLADPGSERAGQTTCIVAEYGAWKHVCVESRHLSRHSRIFDEWLGAPLRRQLRAAWAGQPTESSLAELIRQTGQKMEPLIRQAMNAPLVLVFDSFGKNGGKRGEHWRLPLGNGVRLLAQRHGRHAFLVTFFAPDGWNSKLIPTHRWLSEIRATVETYADFQDGEYRLPPLEKQVTRMTKNRMVHERHIRFHDPLQWGFDGTTAGSRWNPPMLYPGRSSSRLQLVPRPDQGSSTQ